MAESNAHKRLKEIARSELRNPGFTEIKEEYPIDIEGKRFIVDIVGIREGKTVAYECGVANPDKIAKLKHRFNKVVWMPYLSAQLHDKTGESRQSKNTIIDKRTGIMSGQRAIRKIGDSHYINIPKEFLHRHGIKEGDILPFGGGYLLEYIPMRER